MSRPPCAPRLVDDLFEVMRTSIDGMGVLYDADTVTETRILGIPIPQWRQLAAWHDRVCFDPLPEEVGLPRLHAIRTEWIRQNRPALDRPYITLHGFGADGRPLWDARGLNE